MRFKVHFLYLELKNEFENNPDKQYLGAINIIVIPKLLLKQELALMDY
jgi:hypothetical protein